jgi:hypothetical protein
MTIEKKRLTQEVIRAQSGAVLPRRHMLALVNVVIVNVLNNNTVTIPIDINNINVAVNICIIVKVINRQLFDGHTLTCTVNAT